ncbi:hypothetical protein WJX73_004694 [Symbiochloris irregularis]|uniref:CENP-V/GFA domain-containing protein n=1 Tax=Symbiochloris irregularis TaxID=706552 RepID=A0AAW1PW62_9CHLO
MRASQWRNPMACIIYPEAHVQTIGKDSVRHYSVRSSDVRRGFCEDCHWHLYNYVQPLHIYSIPAKNLEGKVVHRPQQHLHFQEATEANKAAYANDGLRK